MLFKTKSSRGEEGFLGLFGDRYGSWVLLETIKGLWGLVSGETGDILRVDASERCGEMEVEKGMDGWEKEERVECGMEAVSERRGIDVRDEGRKAVDWARDGVCCKSLWWIEKLELKLRVNFRSGSVKVEFWFERSGEAEIGVGFVISDLAEIGVLARRSSIEKLDLPPLNRFFSTTWKYE